jgi:hypothetical protein
MDANLPMRRKFRNRVNFVPFEYVKSKYSAQSGAISCSYAALKRVYSRILVIAVEDVYTPEKHGNGFTPSGPEQLLAAGVSSPGHAGAAGESHSNVVGIGERASAAGHRWL